MKLRVLALFACLVLLCGAALAEQSTYVFPYEGFRYTQQENETVLTQTNLHEHAELIEALGTTPDAILASYIASGIVMEVIPDEGGQIAVSVVSAGAFADADSMDELGEERLALFVSQFADSGLYETCELTQTEPQFVRMTSSAMYGSMPVYTLRYATIHLGQMYMLTQTIVGRAPDAQDDARMEQVIGGMKLLSTVAAPTPTPTPVPTPVPTATPVPTPGVAQVITSEGDMQVDEIPAYTNDPDITITGRTTGSAAVRVVVDGKQIGKATAKRDGTFSVRVTLPAEGDNVIAVMTDNAEQMISVHYQMPAARLELTAPEDPVFSGTNVMIKGQTEPEATVYIEGPGIRTSVKASKNGGFSIRVFIEGESTETFTLRAKAKGFAQSETTITLTRVYTEREGVSEFRKKMVALEYDELAHDPQRHAGRQFSFRGKVMEFTDYDGSPCALVCVSNPGTGIWRDPVWVILKSDMAVEVGNVATFYLVGEGQTLPAGAEYTAEGESVEAPVARASYCVEIK